MPKQEANPELQKLAEHLFCTNWRPGTGTHAWKIASDAFAAAGDFLRVADLIASGATPAEIPEYIAAGDSK